MRILKKPNFNFIRWRWHAIVLSLLVIVAGIATSVTRGGLTFGIDFTGGTVIVLEFVQPTSESVVRDAVAPITKESVVQQFGNTGRQIMVRLPLSAVELGATLDEAGQRVEAALKAANVGAFTVVNREIVGPVIGRDLQRQGVYATVASLLGIMAYIAFRFRLSFGVGAIAASFHDVLVTLSILTFAHYEISLNVVAAILALTGYGVNDQIVVFDRVRENLRLRRRDPMDSVINTSVNETLPRTIITAGVTFLSVLALYLFGGEVLEGFAFAMLVGIVTSTYSTIYIASAVAVILSPSRAALPAATAPSKKTAGRRA